MTAPDLQVAHILRETLTLIHRDGWRHDAWGLVPPYCIRRALTVVVEQTHKNAPERNAANTAARQAISDALGQPLGLIAYYEGEPGRTQSEVEAVLEKAIAGWVG